MLNSSNKLKSDIVIQLKDVTKKYKIYKKNTHRIFYSLSRIKRFTPQYFNAVENINLSINKGEILGIIGKNGAGKSTILKLITNVTYPTSGQVKVKGRISSLLELGAGFNPELTGIENVYLQGSIMGLSTQEMDNRIEAITDFADIGEFVNQPVKNYSSGMFARLAFATAINVNPDILIVDEVLAVGDIAFQFKCVEVMKNFAKKGITIIFVTHSMMSLYRFCNRCIWINDGKVKMDGIVEEVVPRYEDFIRSRDEGVSLSKKKVQKEERVMENEFLKISKFQLLQLKKDSREIDVNKPFLFRVEYELLKNLKEIPFCAISIVKSGLTYDMFGVYPNQDRYALKKEKGKYTLDFSFLNPNINVSEYDIYFSILEKNGISQLYFGHALSFKVVGNINSLGLIDIDHKINLKDGWKNENITHSTL